jgi:endonuclease III
MRLEKTSSPAAKVFRGKLPFHLEKMLAAIRKAVRPFPKAMLFEIRERGHDSPFEQLVACVLSVRTLDEVSLPASLRLFGKARSPRQLGKLSREELAALIQPCTFAFQKAAHLLRISEILVRDFEGRAPCDFGELTSLPGVGPKCANLVLGIACGKSRVGVDIHVHRVTNRWGYVSAPTPEKTLAQLEERLREDGFPAERWVEINERLVPFGKHICRGNLPKCSTCPVLSYCRQVGVQKWQ